MILTCFLFLGRTFPQRRTDSVLHLHPSADLHACHFMLTGIISITGSVSLQEFCRGHRFLIFTAWDLHRSLRGPGPVERSHLLFWHAPCRTHRDLTETTFRLSAASCRMVTSRAAFWTQKTDTTLKPRIVRNQHSLRVFLLLDHIQNQNRREAHQRTRWSSCLGSLCSLFWTDVLKSCFQSVKMQKIYSFIT